MVDIHERDPHPLRGPYWIQTEDGHVERLTQRFDSPKFMNRAAEMMGGLMGICMILVMVALFITICGIQATKEPTEPAPIAEYRPRGW
jgi:hypothetical protein